MRKAPLISLLVMATLLCGCGMVDRLLYSTNREAIKLSAIPNSQKWWRSLNDPLLDSLVEQLDNQNIDMKIAQSRLYEARAQITSARSSFFPEFSGNANANRSNTDTANPQSVLRAGFDMSWELDVFGKTRNNVDASEARAAAQAANVDDVRNLMIADLARGVIEWRQAKQTSVVTESLLATQSKQIDLLMARAKAGLIDQSFVERAKAQRAQLSTELPLSEAAARAAQYKIERILNTRDDGVAKLLASTALLNLQIPQPKDIVDVTIDHLRNRPDIRSARASLLAEESLLSVAEADMWPKLTLRNFFGVQDVTRDMLATGNPVWSLASAITAPLFNFGRLQAAVDVAGAHAEQAKLSYENTVIHALEETRTALSDYLNGLNAANLQAESLEHRKDTVLIAQERFERGLTDMTDLTTAQSELDRSSLDHINRKAYATIAFVRLHKALGTAVTKDYRAK